MIWIPIVVFILTLALVILKPKDLGIGYSACLGALILYLFNFVSNPDIYKTILTIWNAVLAFVALVVISYLFNEIGLFKWAAQQMIRISKNSTKRLFTYLLLLGAFVAALFANDGAALILTPIVIAKVSLLNISKERIEPFVMGCGFISDTASILLVTSNLVNIIAADYFHISYLQYALIMWIPFLTSVLMSLVMLHLYYKKALQNLQEETGKWIVKEEKNIQHKNLAVIAIILIVIMFLACFIGGYYALPVSLILLPTSLILTFIARQKKVITYKNVYQATPFSIIFFAFGMFLLVLGLESIGLVNVLEVILASFNHLGGLLSSVCTGVLAGVLSCFANNLPAVMLNSVAISNIELTGKEQLIQVFANIIGSDIGPKMFPIGSLATLLWLHLLEKQKIKISYGRFIKVGIVLTIPTLVVTLAVLFLIVNCLH